jgi:DNA uptake protein ComE-like DNA-binding protein
MRSRRLWFLGMGFVLAVGVAAMFIVRTRQRPADAAAADAMRTRPVVPLPTVNDLRSSSRSNVLQPMSAPQMRTFAAIDLNTASLAELETIPGITQPYAEKIVAGRPYRSLKDLERTGIPGEILEGISPPAVIKLSGAGGPLAPPPGLSPANPQRGPRP